MLLPNFVTYPAAICEGTAKRLTVRRFPVAAPAVAGTAFGTHVAAGRVYTAPALRW